MNYNKRKVIATNGAVFDKLNDQLENKKDISLHLQKCQDLGEAYAAVCNIVTALIFVQFLTILSTVRHTWSQKNIFCNLLNVLPLKPGDPAKI